MIAEPAWSWTRWVSRTSTSRESGALEVTPELLLGQRTGDAAGPLGHVAPGGLVHPGVGDDVGDREAAAWPEHPRRLAEDRRLVGGEVDHAVGDHDVHRVVGQRHLFDRPLQELDILDTRLPLVSARHLEHLVGHVDAIRLAASARRAWPRATRRCRRPSPGRGRSLPREARRPPSDCRSRARRASPRRGARPGRPPDRGRHRTPLPHMHPGRRRRSRTSPGSSLRPSRVRSRRRAPLPPSSPRRRSARAPPLGSRPCRSAAQPCAQFLQ